MAHTNVLFGRYRLSAEWPIIGRYWLLADYRCISSYFGCAVVIVCIFCFQTLFQLFAVRDIECCIELERVLAAWYNSNDRVLVNAGRCHTSSQAMHRWPMNFCPRLQSFNITWWTADKVLITHTLNVICTFYSFSCWMFLLCQGLRCTFNHFIPTFLLCSSRGTEYCNQFVCLSLCVSVCPRASLEQLDRSSRNIFVQIPRGHGSVLLWRRCPTLCTSGFMDDVTFGRSGPYGDTCLAALRSYRGGVWCVWMSCYFVKTCFGGPHSTAWKGWKPVTYTALQWRSQRNNMVPTQTYEY